MTVIPIILANKYFFIFVFLILLYISIKIYDKFPYVKQEQDSNEFLQALHHYYVKNLYYELFVLLMYLLAYFGLFLLLRIQALGKELNIITLSLGNFNANAFISILLYILCVVSYIQIINRLFYPNLVKLHYYFYQFPWYEDIIDRCHMELTWISSLIMLIARNIGKYTWSKKDFDDFSERMIKLERIAFKDSERLQQIEKDHIKQENFWIMINQNTIYYHVVLLLNHFLRSLQCLSRQLRSISYPILVTILLWEIHQGVLYYIYYALFIYFLTVWIKKIRYFLSVRDPLEKAITDYFYNNEIPYTKIKSLLDNSDISKIYNNLGRKTKTVLTYKEELITYILNDFVVYHVRYPTRKANEKYLDNEARRSNLLILIFLAIVYYYVNSSKYILIISGITIQICLLSIPLFLLQYFIYTKILYDTNKTSEEAIIVWAEHKVYKWLFRLILLFMAIPMLYLMIKNKVTVFPNEVLLEIYDYMKVTECYTIEEKMKYLANYLDIVTKALNITAEFKTVIFDKVNKEILLDDGITLEKIRKQIEDIISMSIKDNNSNKVLPKDLISMIYEKIKTWLNR